MSLTDVPQEVLETVLLYVGVEDILNVFSVVGGRGSESFWRRICLQHKYKKSRGEEESWEAVFQRNITWLRGTCFKRDYLVINSLNDTESFSNTRQLLQGQKLVSQIGGVVSIRNVEVPHNLVQELYGECLSQNNLSQTKLLLRNQSSLTIYSCEEGFYIKLLFLNKITLLDSYSLSDDYFAAFESNKRNVKLYYLNLQKELSLPISSKVAMPMTLTICENVLNVLILEGLKYVLRKFNFVTEEWSDDLELFGGAALIGVPKVETSLKVVVCWCSPLEGPRRTTLKIWTVEDNLSLRQELADILWLIVDEDYVIFSKTEKSVDIWKADEPGRMKNIRKPEEHYRGQNIISSMFLVLSYSYCFKVIDYKNTTYLYEIVFDRDYNSFCVNEYLYIICDSFVLNELLYKEDESKNESNQTALDNVSEYHNSNSYENKNKIKTRICIYDFKNEVN